MSRVFTLIAMIASLTAAQAAQAQEHPAPSRVVAKVAMATAGVSAVAAPLLSLRAVGLPLSGAQPSEQDLLGIRGAPHSIKTISRAARGYRADDAIIMHIETSDGRITSFLGGHVVTTPEATRQAAIEFAEKEMSRGSQILKLSRIESTSKYYDRAQFVALASIATLMGSLVIEGVEVIANDALSGLLTHSPKISDVQSKALKTEGPGGTSTSARSLAVHL